MRSNEKNIVNAFVHQLDKRCVAKSEFTYIVGINYFLGSVAIHFKKKLLFYTNIHGNSFNHDRL